MVARTRALPEPGPLWLELSREGAYRPALDTSGVPAVHLHDARGALCGTCAAPFGKWFLADYCLCVRCVAQYRAQPRLAGNQVQMDL